MRYTMKMSPLWFLGVLAAMGIGLLWSLWAQPADARRVRPNAPSRMQNMVLLILVILIVVGFAFLAPWAIYAATCRSCL